MFERKCKHFSVAFAKRLLNTKAIKSDLLYDNMVQEYSNKYDIVFSVGLVEHFNKNNTEKVIQKHFHFVRNDGIVIITAPTPTILYKIIRKSLEIMKMWKFYDERPLPCCEIINHSLQFGDLLEKAILWGNLLTQCGVVFKRSSI